MIEKDPRLACVQALKKWEEEEYIGRAHNFYYNRACARSRLSQNPASDSNGRSAESLVDEALEDLKAAFGPDQHEYWDTDDWKSAVGDCLKGGDLELVTRKHKELVISLLSQRFRKIEPEARKEGLLQLKQDLSEAL